jgi:hypothetical protein
LSRCRAASAIHPLGEYGSVDLGKNLKVIMKDGKIYKNAASS